MKSFKKRFGLLLIMMIFFSSLSITSFAENQYYKVPVEKVMTYETYHYQNLSLARPKTRKSKTRIKSNSYKKNYRSYKKYKRNRSIRNYIYGRSGFRPFRSISRFFKLLIFMGILLIIILIFISKSRRR